MSSLKSCTALGALLLVAVACVDGSTQPSPAEASLVSAAFRTASPGYDSLSSSFSASGNTGVFGPRGHGGPRGMPGDSLGRSDMMGGDFRDEFSGGIGMGPGLGRGPFGEHFSTSTCTAFDAGTGIVTCTPIVRDSLTISRTFQFTTAAGVAQASRDTVTTDRIVTTRSVTGTTTFTPGRRVGFGHGFGPPPVGATDSARVDITTARTTVTSASTRTVSGLATGSTQRTINGASAGRESTEGTSTSGAFTSVRVMGDTTTGLVIPVSTTGYPYPTAGTVIRAMSVSVTYASGAPVSSSRREVITYDGSTTAKISITKDGTTKSCTLALPRGRPVCP
ncbi:MAG: hypothetical protein H7099_12240 [Gemmatimonadaceae bacterium]|nr:hypothetical protein [Gemmatimonadaceae bacterium]